ncbi:MAG: hypothetical protein ABSB33_03940 [Tepidisphaeraceae bacterium]|jgi:hypothetical protein
MKIQNKDIFHGAGLTQIVEHRSFKALNKADEKYGHYLVNTDRRFMLKYGKSKKGPWQFTFGPDDLRTLKRDVALNGKVFLCLVCGDKTVGCLDESEFSQLIDTSAATQQFITLEFPKGGSSRARGSQGQLRATIPHNLFPEKIFR